MRIRLLSPSIYFQPQTSGAYDPMSDMGSYPVIVNAEYHTESYLMDKKLPMLTFEELDRVFPVKFSWGETYKRARNGLGDGLTWWHNEDGTPSFEEVSPFDYWNKLKSSRPVGDVVPRGYL